jgi:hypothetical protein
MALGTLSGELGRFFLDQLFHDCLYSLPTPAY